MLPESKLLPSSDVTVWSRSSLLVQTIVSPFLILISLGANFRSSMLTLYSLASAGAATVQTRTPARAARRKRRRGGAVIGRHSPCDRLMNTDTRGPASVVPGGGSFSYISRIDGGSTVKKSG